MSTSRNLQPILPVGRNGRLSFEETEPININNRLSGPLSLSSAPRATFLNVYPEGAVQDRTSVLAQYRTPPYGTSHHNEARFSRASRLNPNTRSSNIFFDSQLTSSGSSSKPHEPRNTRLSHLLQQWHDEDRQDFDSQSILSHESDVTLVLLRRWDYLLILIGVEILSTKGASACLIQMYGTSQVGFPIYWSNSANKQSQTQIILKSSQSGPTKTG